MKYTFVLKNIDISQIDSKYKFKFKSNINNSTHKQNTTHINDLNALESNYKSYSYLDDSKKKKKCTVTMNNSLGKPLPSKTKIHCFWCKHPFNTKPIGCPIKFNKHSYTTDGIFCSFNCCLSYINDNKHKSMYDLSLTYLSNIHNKLFKIDTFVKPAPHWRILDTFGGTKNINEYRNSFDSIVYEPNNNYIKAFPEQLPIGWIFEENLFI